MTATFNGEEKSEINRERVALGVRRV